MNAAARKVVAVVDDDPRILESLEELLESAGYEPRLYSTGDALLASDLASVDCVITDIGMPNMDGFELSDRLNVLYPALPVFLISGHRVPPDGRRIKNEFFEKPFDGPTLLAAIAKAVAHGNP
jgi:FixJ family two-component response regulator